MNNSHIKEYINYYLSLTTEPQYAVMLKGTWGSGKTWFAENLLEEYKQKNRDFKFLKVSLYGISSVEQIEDEFYRQLHPVLSNKALIFGANVLKNTLKASIKIDLDGDKKPDLDINTTIPNINLSEFKRNKDGFVLVFDDIERTGIDLPILFGYINHFVEVNGYKAILIANEDEITKSKKILNDTDDKSGNDYLRTKEKLVGKTFEVTSDFKSAYEHFLNVISSLYIANIFKAEIKSLEDLYNSANYNNLRHLRQFFLDVHRITNLIGEKYLKNENFIKTFFLQLFIFSMEYRGGNLTEDDFYSIGKINYGIKFDGKNTLSKYDSIVNKYPSPVLAEQLLDGVHWRELICDGNLTSEFYAQIDNTHFFRNSDLSAWQYLWRYRELSEDILNNKYNILKNNLFSRKIESLGEILMTTSILLELTENGLSTDHADKIIDETKININDYYDKLSPEESHNEYIKSNFREFSSYCGMEFLNIYSDHFKAVVEHVKQSREKRFNNSLIEFSSKFSNELQKGELTFLYELSYSSNEHLNLHSAPFLHLISPDIFVSSYMELDPIIMRKLAITLRKRYSNKSTREKLIAELSWLERIVSIAIEYIENKNSSKFKVFHIKTLINHVLENIIDDFKNDK